MSKVIEDIDAAIAMFENEELRKKVHEHYSPSYLFTTENIKDYVKAFDFNNSKVLTVTGSGDQALNVINHNAKSATCFDINQFANYTLALKVAAIKALNFLEFLNFFIEYNKFNYKQFIKIKKYLENDDYAFWNTLFENYSSEKIYKIFKADVYLKKYLQKTNYYCYLKNYNLLKKQIIDCEIKTITTNIVDLEEKLDEKNKYDFILLSNISLYINSIFFGKNAINSFKELLLRLSEFLNEDGKFLYAYEYTYDINFSVFNKYNTQKLLIPAFNSFDIYNNSNQDAVFYFSKNNLPKIG